MPPTPLYPLLFTPFFRPMPWGGQRLASFFPTTFPRDQQIGEAWLLSDHALHASVVANGPLAGVPLRQLMAERGEELLGRELTRFPLLIKLLDAHENLSVQVHPNDDAARRWAPVEGGKTEAWVILDAEREASLYLGLQPGIDKPAFERALRDGTAHRRLNRFHPETGECWFVPAGTVHAIGAGVVLLEVQQTSDATFRLYDWERVGPDGKPRALHLEAGLDCLKPEIDGASLRAAPKGERLVECEYFSISRVIQSARARGPTLFIVIEGAAAVRTRDSDVNLSRGQLALVPAGVEDVVVELRPQSVLVQVDI